MIKYFKVDGEVYYYVMDVNIYYSKFNAIFANKKGEEDKETDQFFIIKQDEMKRIHHTYFRTEMVLAHMGRSDELNEGLDITDKVEHLTKNEFDERLEQLKQEAITKIRGTIDTIIGTTKKLNKPLDTKTSDWFTGTFIIAYDDIRKKVIKLDNKKLTKYFEKNCKELIEFLKDKIEVNDFYQNMLTALKTHQKTSFVRKILKR